MMTVLFAQIREDAAVERAAFASAKRILTIASGGCVALSLLTDDAEEVIAVDANPSQTALIAAKRRAIEHLDLREFLIVAGETDHSTEERARLLERAGVKGLPAHWLARGLLHCGANEDYYRFVGANLRRTILSAHACAELMSARRTEQRQAWLAHYTDPIAYPMWRAGLSVLLSRASHEHFFGRLPFEHLDEDAFGQLFRQRFEAELELAPVADNPFFHQLLHGRYGTARPHYLTHQGYDEVRRNLHKLQVVTSSLTDLSAHVTDGFDGLSLSNVFDWANATEQAEIVRSVRWLAHPSATLVVRQMLDGRPLPLTLTPSGEMPRDRSMLYRSVQVGELR